MFKLDAFSRRNGSSFPSKTSRWEAKVLTFTWTHFSYITKSWTNYHLIEQIELIFKHPEQMKFLMNKSNFYLTKLTFYLYKLNIYLNKLNYWTIVAWTSHNVIVHITHTHAHTMYIHTFICHDPVKLNIWSKS